MANKRLLVIDDDRSLQTLFGVIFNRAGFETEFAADGDEGLLKLSSREYDAVILDLMMPHKSGFEVLDELARTNPTALRRVIITSGASQRLLSTIDASRVHALVRKPFDLDALLATTSRCAND